MDTTGKIIVVTDMSFKTGVKFGIGIAIGSAIVKVVANAVGSKIFDEDKK